MLRSGGAKSVVAESLLLKHQLLIANRSRQRAPNLTPFDRILLGLTTFFITPARFSKVAVALKPATLLRFHVALVKRKYHLLFSSGATRRKPGPKGPSPALIAAVVSMKQVNPRFGCLSQQRQGRRSPYIGQTLSTRIGKWWPVLALPYWPRQGQPVEH